MSETVSIRSLGKDVGGRRYVHASAFGLLEADAAKHMERACAIARVAADSFNVIRFDPVANELGLLNYPDFFETAFPMLMSSWKVYLDKGHSSYRSYSESLNPPILHRKELLLAPSDPRVGAYAKLTEDLEGWVCLMTQSVLDSSYNGKS